jgi:hypothetical protein
MQDSAAAVVSESSVILAATITSLLLLGGVAFNAASLPIALLTIVRQGDRRLITTRFIEL